MSVCNGNKDFELKRNEKIYKEKYEDFDEIMMNLGELYNDAERHPEILNNKKANNVLDVYNLMNF